MYIIHTQCSIQYLNLKIKITFRTFTFGIPNSIQLRSQKYFTDLFLQQTIKNIVHLC